jgi:hypothetical protein
MKRKIFRPLAVLGIGAVVAVNVQLNSNKSENSLLFDNIEALTEEVNTCIYKSSNSNTEEWEGFITNAQNVLLHAICRQTTVTCGETGGSLCCTGGAGPITCVAK